MRLPMLLKGCLAAAALMRLIPEVPCAPAQLVQVHQDFSRDPGWDHYQNRIDGTGMPAIHQDFGWRRTDHTGNGQGEIGGRVENSRRQAYYALPLGDPLTFDDEISASGKLALRHLGLRGVGYVGFFNSRNHSWRVWSSMAFRIWEEDGLGQVMFDWMSSDWQARGAETAILLPPDGAVHSWSFRYDPEARADPEWRDKALERHLTDRAGNMVPYELQGEEHLLLRLQIEEPGLTREELRRRLLEARDQGLVEYFHRHNMHRWWKRPGAGTGHGRVALQFDGEIPYVFWFDPQIRKAPAAFDRFGLFNIARFGSRVEIYLGDLTVNGRKFDLSQNPYWEGHNNESQYDEPNFHGMHSYGWSQTHWAGETSGEIGGLMWSTEPPDPLCSYYGDDVGLLTLDDPISFSGAICFTAGMTDASAYFGYFNRDNQIEAFQEGADGASPIAGAMGILISDLSSVGYYFVSQVAAADRKVQRSTCDVFRPDRRRRAFTFDYDPEGNGGTGQVKMTLDGQTCLLDLSPQQRETGATFNRFGLANVRHGGHSVEFYIDDLTYTARRAPGVQPEFIPQTEVKIPYPHKQAGRRY
ncbi:MAG TPA: hypothetical protein VMN36_08445 [Verrucomicrobiales bacterium]|nr:hypothetical protein [Verrucomicrobiales bacterium]